MNSTWDVPGYSTVKKLEPSCQSYSNMTIWQNATCCLLVKKYWTKFMLKLWKYNLKVGNLHRIWYFCNWSKTIKTWITEQCQLNTFYHLSIKSVNVNDRKNTISCKKLERATHIYSVTDIHDAHTWKMYICHSIFYHLSKWLEFILCCVGPL